MQKQAFDIRFPYTTQYLKGIEGLAKKLTIKYNQMENEEDFIQVAITTACGIERKFKQADASFYTYCVKPIITAIQKEFGNPMSSTSDYKIISKFIANYENTHNLYPDVHAISSGTGLSIFDITAIYFDRHRIVQLDSVDEQFTDVSNPFVNLDFDWVNEHLESLTSIEKALVDKVFYQGFSLKQASESMGMKNNKAKGILDEALAKIKKSIEEYE
jgi:DNA-directed RNA polymerase specialized sigma subunit